MVTLTPGPAHSASHEVRDRPDDLSGRAHRQLIGYIGLLLPAMLIFLVIWRDGLEQWQSLDSISAYYYTGAVAAFVGMLVSLSLFLFTYRGYANERHTADRAAAIIAAVAALGVALFPTGVPAGFASLGWWSKAIGVIHAISATVLFSTFAVFALWLFRMQAPGQPRSPGKAQRNAIYLICGLAIVAGIVWAFLALRAHKSIFLPESLALIAFAVSWLVKGYAHRSIRSRIKKILTAEKGAVIP